MASGLRYVIDIDLAKFFDRVNHDRLMARLAAKITDKRVLKLIRSFLNSGVMIDGLEQPTKEGTPQGGPLSPILSSPEKPGPPGQDSLSYLLLTESIKS